MEEKNCRKAYGLALVELGRRHKNLVVLDADLAVSTHTIMFKKEFPDRFFDVGVAEQNMMDTAAGLAATGKIVFASTFAVFATGRPYDQIRQSIAYPNLPVKIVATHAGVTVGADGASHQTTEDVALMRVLPNMSVYAPADYYETFKIVVSIAEAPGPAYVRIPRPSVPVIFDESYRFRGGEAVVMCEGGDVAIISMGTMLYQCLEAANLLGEEGIEATVLHINRVKPIDVETLVRVAGETGAVVTVEEHSIIGGLGSCVAEVLGENNPVPMVRVGIPDVFGQSGSPGELLRHYGLTAESIAKKAKKVFKRKKEV